MTVRYSNETESDYVQRLRADFLNAVTALGKSADLAQEFCQRAERRTKELEEENEILKENILEHVSAKANLKRDLAASRDLAAYQKKEIAFLTEESEGLEVMLTESTISAIEKEETLSFPDFEGDNDLPNF